MNLEEPYIVRHPDMHRADAPRKIEELTAVLPALGALDTVVEVGCGLGIVGRAIAERVGATAYFGLDHSAEIIDLARSERINPSRVVPRWKVGSLPSDLGDSGPINYDLLCLVDVLEHLTDPGDFLAEWSHSAEWLLLRSPLENCWWNRVKRRIGLEDVLLNTELAYGHIQHFSQYRLCRLLKESGFDMVAMKLWHPPWTHRRVLRPVQVGLWHLRRQIGARIWGGFATALCRTSRPGATSTALRDS